MSRDNANTIEQGLQRARNAIFSRLANRVSRVGSNIIYDELRDKEYNGFTGNAQTSYTAQVFLDSKLVSENSTGNTQEAPLHRKVYAGESVFLEAPYEGDARTVTGKAEIDKDWADDTISDIRHEDLPIDSGLVMRIAVGIEYNDYIGDPIGYMRQAASRLDARNFRIDTKQI